MLKKESGAACPICLKQNACNVQGDCWCFHLEIPAALLALLEEGDIDRFCVCKSCVDSFNSDSEAFKRTYFAC